MGTVGITCSVFKFGKLSVVPCEIHLCWSMLVPFMLDANNLDYCVTLLIFFSFLLPLAQAVLSSWATQTVLACPIVQQPGFMALN